ncbi:SRPBCC family protein [Nocardia jejuensis]|uniref:SRPBCC family protein n=1 Tax=Nocardia jejuensis TaxID=328049 RepID=UPI000832DCB1|nr:SRPBCC family protein [Nocardia jejuensis]
METIVVERVIAAPASEVFEWLADSSNYTRSSVVLRSRLARTGEGADYGVGAVRVLTWVIGWFRERITGYDAPHEFTYVVERSIPPSRHEGGGLTFTGVAGGTRVVWTTRAEMAVPILAGPLTRLLVKPVVRYSFTKVLAAAEAALTR